jgi:putative spermidine/putrescine transport system permease protein
MNDSKGVRPQASGSEDADELNIEDEAAVIYGEEKGSGRAIGEAFGSKLTGWLWALPGILWLLIFLVAPVLVIVVISFFETTLTGFEPWAWTTRNYTVIFSGGSGFLETLTSVIINAAIVTVVCIIFGYPIAYFLATKIRSQRVAIALFIVAVAPFFTSALIRVVAWIPTMGQQGAVNQIITGIGIVDTPLAFLLFSDFAVIVALTQLLILFMIAPIFFQLAAMDRSAIEAARDLGASQLNVFRHVILPLTRPGILIGSVFVFVLSLGDFATYRVVGGGRVGSIGINIQNAVTQLQSPIAGAQAAILVLVMVAGVVILLRFARLRERW